MLHKWSVQFWEVDVTTPDRLDFQIQSADEFDATGLYHITRSGEIIFDYEYNDNSPRQFPFRKTIPQYLMREIRQGAKSVFEEFDSRKAK